MGTYLAGVLSKDNSVILLGKEDIVLKEITIEGSTDIRTDVVYTTSASRIEDAQCIILCTKSYDTRSAVKQIGAHISKDAYVVSLQNGLKNEAVISEYVDTDKVVGGVTSHGFTFKEKGRVLHTGMGDTIIGKYPSGEDKRVDDIADIFTEAGIPTGVTNNVYGHIWKKVIINAGINPITALTGIKNGDILENTDLKWLMQKVCSEAAHVASTQVELPVADPVKAAEEVAKNTSENLSSMLQDIMNERQTEIDCINGAIIDIGKNAGIDTPFNRILWSLVKARSTKFFC